MFRLFALVSAAWLFIFQPAVAENNSSAYFGPHALFQNGKPNLFYKEGFTPTGAQKGFTVDWLKDRSPTATANRIVGSTTPLSFGPIKFTVTGTTPVAGSTFLTGAGGAFYVGGDKVRGLIMPPMLDSDLVPRFLTVPIDYCPDYNDNHYIWMTTMLSKGQKTLGVNAYSSESAFFGEGILNASGGNLSATVTHRFGLNPVAPPTFLQVLGGYPSVPFTCSLGQYVASGGGSLGGSLLHNEGNAELSLPGGGNYTTSENGAVGQQLVSYDQAKISDTSPDGRISRTTVNGAFNGNYTVTDYTITAGSSSRDNLTFGQASYSAGAILYTPYSDPSKGTLDLTKQIEITIRLVDTPRDGMFTVSARSASNGVASGAPTIGAGIYNSVEFWTKDFVIMFADPYNFPYARFLHFSTAGTADLRVTAVDGVSVSGTGTVSFGDLAQVGPQTKTFTLTNVGARPAARIGLGDTAIAGATPTAFEFTGGFPGGAGPAFCAPGMILLAGESCTVNITSRALPTGTFVAAALANIEYFDGEQTWRTTQGLASTSSFTSLACNAPTLRCAAGDKIQLSATATVGGSPFDVTNVVPWQSTVGSVASVSSVNQTTEKGGVVTCLSPGTTQVSANLAGQSCSAISISVDPAPGIFLTGATSIAKDRCVPYTVSVKTASNAPYVLTAEKVFQILGNGNNKAYLDPGCTVPTFTVTVPEGASSKNFFFQSGVTGTFTLIVDDNGLWGNATAGNVNQRSVTVNANPPPTSACGELALCDDGDLDSICYIRSRKCVGEIVGIGDLVLEDGGSIEPVDHTLFIQMRNVTLNTGTQINLDGFGDVAAFGAGKGENGQAAGGGGHGGGGDTGYSNPGGATGKGGSKHGDMKEPEDLGSGGGNPSGSAQGGAGGGALRMIVNNLKNEGSIHANGKQGLSHVSVFGSGQDDVSSAGGGGAGGSIWLDVTKLSGSGTIVAQGGAAKSQGPTFGHTGNSVTSGRGGGGRIALYYFVNELLVSKITTPGFEEGTRYLEQKIGPPMKLGIFGANDVNRDFCYPYTIKSLDAYGSPATVLVDTFATVTVTGAAKLYPSAGCSGAGISSLSLILEENTKELTYYMKGTTVQNVVMSATSTTLAAATNLPIGIRVFGPTLSTVSPSTGFANSVFELALTGAAFRGGATASVGSTPCTTTTVTSATAATCLVPSLGVGSYTVTFTNPDSQFSSKAAALNLVSRANVTGVSPAKVPVAGGTTIYLTGSGFEAGMTIRIGGVACGTSTFVSPTSMTCLASPALVAGFKDLIVADSGGNGTTLENGIEYREAPTLTSITPTHGKASGGVSLSLVGTHFYDGAKVFTGLVECTGVAVQDEQHATCTTGAQTAGTYAVHLTNYPENITTGETVNYVTDAPPAVTTFTPSTLVENVARLIHIDGGPFFAGSTGKVDGTDCAPSYVSPTRLDCVLPALSAGTRTVVITNPDGQTGSKAIVYNPAPSLTSLSPVKGRVAGGDVVVLTGTGFLFGAVPKFAGTACTDVDFLGATSLRCNSTPSYVIGSGETEAVDVVVENPDGGSATKSASFTYRNPPSITSFSPTHGPAQGGTSVTIIGNNFFSGATASLKGVTCQSTTIVDPTQITCVSAPGTGTGNAAVTNDDSSVGTKSGWTYDAAPAVVSASPAVGPASGGTTITVTGTGFIDGLTITVGGTTCTSPTWISATSATCLTAAGTAGGKMVRVTNPDGQYHEALAFSYRGTPVITSVTPDNGVNGGGANVTISGSGFTPASGETLQVLFGSKPCTNPVATSSTTITCTTPTNPSGAVRVTVKFLNSAIAEGYLDAAYTYTGGISIQSVTPAMGGTAGGTVVAIVGSGFASGAVAKIGSTNCTSTAFVSATQVNCTTPAGSLGVANVTVTNTDSTTVTATGAFTYGTVLATLCASGDLSPGNTCTVSSTITVPAAQDVVIAGGGDLVFTSTGKINCSAGNKSSVTIDVRNITMPSGSQIGFDGCGYQSNNTGTLQGFGPGGGTGGGSWAQGGSHGGLGGTSPNSAVNDSLDNPTDYGSAGGAGNTMYVAGAGGGKIIIRASGTATLNGTITAKGLTGSGNAPPAGGGAGGTINIDAGSVTGTGAMAVSGGDGFWLSGVSLSSSGGGGRVAVKATTMTGFVPSLNLAGGVQPSVNFRGGSGTYYALDRTANVATLKIDNGTSGYSVAGTIWNPATNPINSLIVGVGANLTILTDSTVVLPGANWTFGTGSNVVATTTDFVASQAITWDRSSGASQIRSFTAPSMTLTGTSSLAASTLTSTTGQILLQGSGTVTTAAINPATDLNVNGTTTTLSITGTGTTTAAGTTTVNGTLSGSFTLNTNVLTVASTGTLHADALGGIGGTSSGNYGAGLGIGTANCAGGSYGGYAGGGGSIYGSVENPTDTGSGGAYCVNSPGNRAGGRLRLNVTTTLTNNGAIRANASSSQSGGGGSGGSVWITAATFAGTNASAVVTANGSSPGGSNSAHGGAGGRIAVESASNTYVGTYQAYGGKGTNSANFGGAGTVWLRNTSSGVKDLSYGNPNTASGTTISNSYLDPSTAYTTLNVGNYVNLKTAANATLQVPSTFAVQAQSTLSSLSGTLSLVSSGSMTLSGGGTMLPTSLTATSLNVSGGLTLGSTGARVAVTAPSGVTLTSGTAYIGSVASPLSFINVTSNGNLFMSSDFTLTGALTIAGTWTGTFAATVGGTTTISGTLTANALGALGGNSTSSVGYGTGGGGMITSTSGAGGGYGGKGGMGLSMTTSQRGNAYGSFSQPTALGSGGGSPNGTNALGGAGGGALKIVSAGAITVSGAITANGGAGVNYNGTMSSGGGSGGSIWLDGPSIAGGGNIWADGGVGGTLTGGAGGGGRIAIYHSGSTFTGGIHAYGGLRGSVSAERGGSGTVYVYARASSSGTLTIGNNGSGTDVAPPTPWDPSEVAGTSLAPGVYANVEMPPGTSWTLPSGFGMATGVRIAPSSGTLAVSWPGASMSLSGGGTLFATTFNATNAFSVNSGTTLGSSTAPTALTVGSGGFQLLGTGTAYLSSLSMPGDLTTASGSSLYWYGPQTTIANATLNGAVFGNVIWNIGNLTLTSSGSINANGYGGAGGTSSGSGSGAGAGVGNSSANGGGGGGGHGGKGGYGNLQTTANYGASYDSLLAPDQLGSGGGASGSAAGGAGGGRIRIAATGTITNAGTISADGVQPVLSTYSGGGGSGGSVWLTAATFAGAGTGIVRANGGNPAPGGSTSGGGGGGGRVAVSATTITYAGTYAAIPGSRQAAGGSRGGAGTIAVSTPTTLAISFDSTAVSGDAGAPTPFDPTAQTSTSITLGSYVTLEIASCPVTFPHAVSMGTGSRITSTGAGACALQITGNFDAGSSAVVTGDVTATGSIFFNVGSQVGTVGNPVALTAGTTLTATGSTVYAKAVSVGTDLTINGSTTFNYTSPTLTIERDLILGGTGSLVGNIDLLVKRDLTVPGGTSINANGLGGAGGLTQLPGAGAGGGGGATNASSGGAGGSYGANAGLGVGSNAVGTPSGDTLLPVDKGFGGGGGGGANEPGGAGGGALKVTVQGTTTLGGTIGASGVIGTGNGGGGSGGSVLFIGNTLAAGTGIFAASGGDGSLKGGGGSGGRIAVYYQTSSFTGSYRAWSGKGGGSGGFRGGVGTAYIEDTASPYSPQRWTLQYDNDPTPTTQPATTPWHTSVTSLDKLTIGNGVNLVTPANTTLTYASTVTFGNYVWLSPASGTLDIDVTGAFNSGTGGLLLLTSIDATGDIGMTGTNVGSTSARTAVATTGGNINVNTAATLYASALTIGNATKDLTVAGNLYYDGTLAVPRHLTNSGTIFGNITYQVAGTFLNSGTLDANSLGGAGGAPAAKGEGMNSGLGGGVASTAATMGGAGGSHGGYGGKGLSGAATDDSYGGINVVATKGSGGGGGWGAGATGGNGGGFISITANALSNGGTIRASGAAGSNGTTGGGGGAGGGIYVSTPSLSGAGTFAADGGTGGGTSFPGGSGAGGRIAVVATASTFSGTYSTVAGSKSGSAERGGAGFIYKSLAGVKTIVFDNGANIVPVGETRWTPSDTAYDALSIGVGVNLKTPPGTLTLPSATLIVSTGSKISSTSGTLTLNFPGAGTISGGTVLANLSAGGDLTVNGTSFGDATTSVSLSATGSISFNVSGATQYLSSLTTGLDLNFLVAGTMNYSGSTLTVPRNLTFSSGSYTLNMSGTINVGGTMTMISSTTISADGLGGAGGNGNGVNGTGSGPTSAGGGFAGTTVTGGNGGSHAGYGGKGVSNSGVYGDVYGAIDAPVLPGSGGGGGNLCVGGNGGGVLHVVASTLVMSGVLSAEGATGGSSSSWGAGGGAGGSIYVEAGTISSAAGTFRVRGGTAGGSSTYAGGGGSGGRIAVLYDTASSYSPAYLANSGTRNVAGAQAGGVGTIFEKNRTTNVSTLSFVNTSGFGNTPAATPWDTSGVTPKNVTIADYATVALTPGSSVSIPGNFSLSATTSSLSAQSGTYNVIAGGTLQWVGGTVNTGLALLQSAGNMTLTGTAVGSAGAPVSIVSTGGTIAAGSTNVYSSGVAAAGDITFSSTATMLNDGLITSGGTILVTGQVLGNIDISAANMTVNAATFINATGFGDAPVATAKGAGTGGGNGGGTTGGAGGAGYGGAGGNGFTYTGGAAFGSDDLLGYADFTSLPKGSAGGSLTGVFGATGGGKIRLHVRNAAGTGTLTVNGSILTNGSNGGTNGTTISTGGSAGGSLLIDVDKLAGTTGAIRANGGNSTAAGSSGGGGGGGGRIQIYANSSTYSGATSATGGTAATGGVAGGAGTILSTVSFTNPSSAFPTKVDIQSPPVGATNACVGLLVGVQDAKGNYVNAPTYEALAVTAPGVTFYNTSACTGSAVTTIGLPAGTSRRVIYAKLPGSATTASISIAASGLTTGTASVTVGGTVLPYLTQVPDYSHYGNALIAGQSVLTVDFNDESGGYPGSDAGMTYACTFDQTDNGDVSGGAACTTLPGGVSFSTSTGLFTWYTGVGGTGTYEIKVTGTNASGTSTRIFLVNVRPNYSTTQLRGDFDPYFSKGTMPSGNAETNTVWTDLSSYYGDASLKGTAGQSGTWLGDGTSTNPFRLLLDGSGRVNFGTSALANQTRFALNLWIKPTSVSDSGVTILGNSQNGSMPAGISIRQSRVESGRLQITAGRPAVDYILDDVPYAFWPLSESSGTKMTDLSGSGLHGTCTGGTRQTSSPTTNDQSVGSTLFSFGTNSTTGCLATGALSIINGDETHTIEMWINNQSLGYLLDTPNVNAETIYVASSSNLTWKTGGNTRSYTVPIGSSQWVHLVFVKKGPGDNGDLYLNGALQTNYTGTLGTMSTGTGDILIGRARGTSSVFAGAIANVAIYASSFSAAQALAHYQAGLGSYGRLVQVNSPVLTNNAWHFLTVAYDGTNLKGQVNAGTTYTVPTTSDLVVTSTSDPLVAGSAWSTSPAETWVGSLGELHLYGTTDGTTPTVASQASVQMLTTADRYRTQPVGAISESGLFLHFDVANSAMPGFGVGSCGGTFPDISGTGNTGTPTNFTCSASVGLVGTGANTNPYRYEFPGSATAMYINTAQAPWPTATGAQDFTFELWVKPGSSQNSQASIMGNPSAAGTNGANIEANGATNAFGLAWGTGSVAATLVSGTRYTTLTSGVWSHFVVVKSGTTVTNYVNGALSATWTASTATVGQNAASAFLIGVHPAALARTFNGGVAKAAGYNRALSLQEISNNCKALQYRFSGVTCN